MRKNILITAMPQTGKSTMLRRLIAGIKDKVGFVTNEVRENGERVGFEIETHAGEKAMLAHVTFASDIRVSRYFVNTKALDAMIPKVATFTPQDTLYIDEIGQMQSHSDKFKRLVLRYLDAPNTCIAIVSKVFADEFIEGIKKRKDVIVVDITMENRDAQQLFLETLIKKIAKARRYASEPKRFIITQRQATITTDHGVRQLSKTGPSWRCDCYFFKEHAICSHVLALEALQEQD